MKVNANTVYVESLARFVNATPYVYKDGAWVKGTMYVYKDGAWVRIPNWVAAATRPEKAMTSNNSQGYVVYADPIYSSSYAAWKAFNKNLNNQDSWATPRETLEGYIQIKLDVALKDIVVTITNRVSDWPLGPHSGTIQGSDDGQSWKTICSFSGRDGETAQHSTTHVCTNVDAAYQYVRLNVRRTEGDLLAIGEIAIDGKIAEETA